MTRLSLRDRTEVPELEEAFRNVESRMGFLPNSQLVMAHKPKLVKAFRELRNAIYDRDGDTPLALLSLVGAVASMSAGCQYCTAHSSSNAVRQDAPPDKVAALWEYETSPLFSEAERMALRFGQAAAAVPNAVTDADMAEMKKHFSETQILEILAVVSWYGFLNRFNDTLATTLEEEPTAFAERTLAAGGWHAGKHAAAE